ncbi:MAG: alkyldihydroxyacetonephosphate synthase [Thermoleophilaceae bacterium]|nr:alkyldihydroxyacetonephosphate synthase [Thermoleophilaceae bacterium]
MATTAKRALKFWGWGYEDQQPPPEEVRQAAAGIRAHLGFEPAEVELPVELDAVELPAPRLAAPAALEEICSSDTYDRATHAQGKGYRDVIRAFRGRLDHPPDVVAHPRDEREVEAVLDWCASAGAAVIPFGGGTSVVGGVEPRVGDGYEGAVSIDLRALDQVLEVDRASRAARIQAGALGPALEDQLRPHELTLRHFPQSFEYSSLGGWIATRAGGHFATRLTHIDDLVESVRAITPSGEWESRRLPGSGAGPSPDRMLIGSEGTLGVITEAWVRLQDRPRFRASAGVRFATFEQGAAAVRALSQSGLEPSNCRLLEAGEAAITGAGDDGRALLVLGFESADHPLDPWMERALELCRDHGGEGKASERREGDASSQWRSAFLAAPYIRDTMVAAGVFSETFETAITWDRLDGYVSEVREVAQDKLRELSGGGSVTCRFTHVYPDGAAPYFTMLAPAVRGQELDQWDAVKSAASDAVMRAGGTITHHHAVGRDHRPWYDGQRPEPFARALRAAKAELDPAGILNPGVLIDPA